MKFIDEVKISVKSGKGGAGCVSFRREKYVPRGGPDGGDGGAGGSIVFRTEPRLNSLVDFRHQRVYLAGNGKAGGGQNMSGHTGKDQVLKVPPGTIVRQPSGELIVDLAEKGSQFTFMSGGRGGKGNTHFKSPTNQAPQWAQPGEQGDEAELLLELRLIADVGIIGYPNAGKSTLISRLSAAKPKIADYPFTTLTPNLGVMKLQVGQSLVLADIPGLIPGAHKGVGLGIQFLKHIQRTQCFLHVLDGNPLTDRELVEDYLQINNELEAYDPELIKRRQVVVVNKAELIEDQRKFEIQQQFTKLDIEVEFVSAVTGEGLPRLTHRLGDLFFE